MSYCDIDDIKNDISEADLIQLTDDDNAGVVDEAKVTDAIADADSEIDMYLRGRYDLPLDPVPRILKKFSVGITIYYLHMRRRIGSEISPDDAVAKRYKNALDELKLIAENKAHLVEADGDAVADEGGPQASKDEDDRVFSDDTLENY
jgi:phage gp36-like protein